MTDMDKNDYMFHIMIRLCSVIVWRGIALDGMNNVRGIFVHCGCFLYIYNCWMHKVK